MSRSRLHFPASLLSITTQCFGAGVGADLQITVHLYDYSGMQSTAILDVQRAAEVPLRMANIQVQWRDCPVVSSGAATPATCGSNTDDPTHLVVVVLPESMSHKMAPRPLKFGAAVSGRDGGFPTQAYVFADRVTDFAKAGMIPRIPVLGAIMAHEIGHLLLGDESHSPAGIMSGRWRPEQIKLALMGLLTFNPQQAEQMRREIRRRMNRKE
jgi:hypothetical protein